MKTVYDAIEEQVETLVNKCESFLDFKESVVERFPIPALTEKGFMFYEDGVFIKSVHIKDRDLVTNIEDTKRRNAAMVLGESKGSEMVSVICTTSYGLAVNFTFHIYGKTYDDVRTELYMVQMEEKFSKYIILPAKVTNNLEQRLLMLDFTNLDVVALEAVKIMAAARIQKISNC